MFNDLNNSNAVGHQAIDDIFAETDKPSNQSEIETHRVGLSSNEQGLSLEATDVIKGKNNYLKIVIIVVVSLVVLGGAYFVYSQFFQDKAMDPTVPVVVDQATPKTEPAPIATTTEEENNFVEVIPEIIPEVIPPVEISVDPIIPAEIVPTSTVDSLVDSDNDGLTDLQENEYGTNINIIDTDNDGLSDYEETKVYNTNPLKADTDSDSYLDGAEVKGGYNPNGTGKL